MSFIDEVLIANNLIAAPVEVEQKISKPELTVGHGYSGQLYKQPPESTPDYEDLYSSVASVYRCVSVISQSIAGLELQVLDADTDEKIDVKKYPDLKIFQKPNKWQTYYDFWEATWGYLELTGECPWLLQRNSVGLIRSMIPLRPDRIKIMPSATDYVDHYTFSIEGEQVPLEAEDIHFWKYFNPKDEWRGISPLAAAEGDIILEIYAIKANKKVYKKGARPSGVLTTDSPVTPNVLTELSEKFNAKYAGYENIGKVVFLSHGFQWQNLSMTNKDLQMMEQRQYSDDQIGQVYGVPPIYRMKFKEASVLANAEEQSKLFWEVTILPKLMKTEQIMNEIIVPDVTTRKVKVQFDRARINSLRKDMFNLAKTYNLLFKYGGATPNMILTEVLGKPAVDKPEMNTFYIDPNLLPLTEIGVAKNKEFNRILAQIRDIQHSIDINTNTPLLEQVGQSVKGLIESTGSISKKDTARRSRARFVRMSQQQIKKFVPILAELFEKQGKEVLKNLRTQKIFKQVNVSAVQFDFSKWVEKFKKAGKPKIAEAIELAMVDLANEVGNPTAINVSSPRVQTYIGARVDGYAHTVNETTKDKIDNIIKSGISAGESIDDMALKLEVYFESAQKFRSQLVARTETVNSMNFGRVESMSQLGYKKHRWMTMRDGQVRDSHLSADGQVVKIDEEFTQLGGDYGGDRTYPSDFNERCYTIPVEK